MPPCRVSRRDRLVLGDSKGVLERGSGCTEEELEAPGGWEGGDVRQRTQQGNVTEREQLPGWQLRGGGCYGVSPLVLESSVSPYHAQDKTSQATTPKRCMHVIDA